MATRVFHPWALVVPGLAILACGTILTARLAASDAAGKNTGRDGQETGTRS